MTRNGSSALEQLRQKCVTVSKKIDNNKGLASCKAHDDLSEGVALLLLCKAVDIEISQRANITTAKIAGAITAIAMLVYALVDNREFIMAMFQ